MKKYYYTFDRDGVITYYTHNTETLKYKYLNRDKEWCRCFSIPTNLIEISVKELNSYLGIY